MSRLDSREKKRQHLPDSVRLPLDYWETLDAVQGGIVTNISESGILFHSVHKIEIGANLMIRVYLSKEYGLDQAEGSGRIVWMSPHQEQDWQGYKYSFHIMQMHLDDRDRLIKYFLKFQEEESSPNEERPFDDSGKYISAPSNRKREASLSERSLRIVNDILQWLKN